MEAHEPNSLRRCCRRVLRVSVSCRFGCERQQSASLVCRHWGAAQTKCLAETRGARNLRAFSATARRTPCGTDIGMGSTDLSTTASCARKRSNSHSEHKATIPGGCAVGEIQRRSTWRTSHIRVTSYCAWFKFQRRQNCVRASPVLEFSSSKAASGSVCNKRFFKAAICPDYNIVLHQLLFCEVDGYHPGKNNYRFKSLTNSKTTSVSKKLQNYFLQDLLVLKT